MKGFFKKTSIKKAASVFVVLCMLWISMGAVMTVSADEVPTVNDEAELRAVIDDLNTNGGSATVQLGADIAVADTVGFSHGTLTILGGGHFITFTGSGTRSVFSVSGDAVMNLGKTGSGDTLIVKSNCDEACIISISGSAELYIYEGATLGPSRATAAPGAVNASGSSKIYLKGGTISNCVSPLSTAGAIALTERASFVMDSGLIENCDGYIGGAVGCSSNYWGFTGEGNQTFVMNGGTIRNCTSSYLGGGAVCFYTSTTVKPTFVMNGGLIESCSAVGSRKYGGAVFVYSGSFEMNGGKITDCNSNVGTIVSYASGADIVLNSGEISGNHSGVGGGLYVGGTAVVANGFKLYDNDAFQQGDEIKKTANGVLTLGSVDASLALTACGHTISGWYSDGKGDRWSETNANVIPAGVYGAGTAMDIKAAHGLQYTVSFDLGYAAAAEDLIADQTVASGDKAVKPADPVKTNYEFLGWYTDADVLFDFDTDTIDANTVLHAKWRYTGYLNTVTLNKQYRIKDGYTGAGDIVNPDGKLTETVKISIVPYISFNRQVGKTEIPEFAQAEYEFPAGTLATGEIVIDLPDFTGLGVGDYWYKVTEAVGDTAGVAYDTTTYYLHIAVMRMNEFDPSEYGVQTVLLHKTAPDAAGDYPYDDEGDKVEGVTNEYAMGEISITKKIKGNMADPDKRFKVDVTFTAEDGKVISAPITFIGGFVNETGADAYTDATPGSIVFAEGETEKTVSVWLIGDSTVTFSNIPDGTKYEITEASYATEHYKTSYAIDSDATEVGDVAAEDKVTGTIGDDKDAIVITNEKDMPIDVGVILNNRPYWLLLVGSLVCGVALPMCKRKKVEELD